MAMLLEGVQKVRRERYVNVCNFKDADRRNYGVLLLQKKNSDLYCLRWNFKCSVTTGAELEAFFSTQLANGIYDACYRQADIDPRLPCRVVLDAREGVAEGFVNLQDAQRFLLKSRREIIMPAKACLQAGATFKAACYDLARNPPTQQQTYRQWVQTFARVRP